MKKLISAISLTLGSSFLSVALATTSPTEIAQNTISNYFQLATKNDMAKLKNLLSKNFISIRHDKISRRYKQQLQILRTLHAENPIISNMQASRSGDVIVATYLASITEKINGKLYSTSPMPRLTVLQENKQGKWQILAHANFNLPAEH